MRTQALGSLGWLLASASCAGTQVSAAQEDPVPGIMLCCYCLEIVNFCN